MDRKVVVNSSLLWAIIAMCFAGVVPTAAAQESNQPPKKMLGAEIGAGLIAENTSSLTGNFQAPAYGCRDCGGQSGGCIMPCDGALCGQKRCRKSSLTARVGVLFMKRESPDNVALITDNSGAGPTILNGGDFDFNYQAGIETSLIYDNPNLPAPLEARYFWLNDWTNTQSAAGLTNAVVNTTPPVASYAVLDRAIYKSQLQSFELHFRKQVRPDITLLAGFRYIGFDEDLDMLLDANDRFWWGVENDLYGFQLGAEGVLYDNGCGLKLEGILKAGIYGNDASVATQVLLNEQAPSSQGSGMDKAAFFGELGLIGTYDLSCCWKLRAGYQAMWLDGVLAAANQVAVTNASATTIGYDYTGVLFHGATAQLERRW